MFDYKYLYNLKKLGKGLISNERQVSSSENTKKLKEERDLTCRKVYFAPDKFDRTEKRKEIE